jgi:phosphate transport system permease protein
MPTDAAAITLGSSMTAEALPRIRRPSAPPDSPRARGAWADWVFERATLVFALLVLGLLAGILAALGIAAAPALEKFGIGFFFTNIWNPVKGIFGVAPICGTLVTSAIALLIGVPVSFGIALFLTEMCPVILEAAARHGDRAAGRDPVDHLRIWGLFVFAPLFGDYVQPLLTQTLGHVPIVGAHC